MTKTTENRPWAVPLSLLSLALLLLLVPALAENQAHHTLPGPGYLGVNVCAVTQKRAASLGMKQAQGVEIVEVDRDAPAGKIGLEVHDVILAINGHAVESRLQLGKVLALTHPGQQIHLDLLRKGVHKDLTVKLASREQVAAEAWPQEAIVTGGPASGAPLELPFAKDFGSNLELREFAMVGSDGLDVEPLSSQLASFFGAPRRMGLLVRDVEPGSHAAIAGLKAGDVITAINGLTSGTLQSWLMVLAQNQGKPIQLKVIRNHKFESIRYTPGGKTASPNAQN